MQDGFLALGYERLEDACDKAGGFVDVREPTPKEAPAIRLLEELTTRTLAGFFGDAPLPPCRVIERETASWEGMAVCQRLGEPVPTPRGHRVRYRLPYIALKKTVFRRGGFPSAWSTYLHELAHCFGGDQSASFSLALTDILRETLAHGQQIHLTEKAWDACLDDADKPAP